MASPSTPLSTQYATMQEAEVVNPTNAVRKNSSTTTSAKTKKRVRNFTATDRAAHRVFEKSRREAFKKRLVQLAGFIPALAETNEKQLSKHIVVDKSIERHKLQQTRCSSAIISIRALMQERDELLAEVNEWRRQCGHSEMKTALPLDPTVDELLGSGQEVFRDLPDRNEDIDISMKQARRLDEQGEVYLESDGEGGGLRHDSQESSPPNSNENGSKRQTQSSPEEHGTSPEDVSSGLPRLTGDLRLHSWTGDMQPLHSPLTEDYRPSSAGMQLPNFVPDGTFPQFPMNVVEAPSQPMMLPQDHHTMTFHEGGNPFHPNQHPNHNALPFSPSQFLPIDEQDPTWLPWNTQNQDSFTNYMPSQEVSKF